MDWADRFCWSAEIRRDPDSLVSSGCHPLDGDSLIRPLRPEAAVPPASAAACLTWERPSVDVRWRPPLAVAIVTHLVTRLPASDDRACGRGSAGAGINAVTAYCTGVTYVIDAPLRITLPVLLALPRRSGMQLDGEARRSRDRGLCARPAPHTRLSRRTPLGLARARPLRRIR